MIVSGEEEHDFSKFMVIPSLEEEHQCYEIFFITTSNEVLLLCICLICAQEKFHNEGEQTWLLSDSLIVEVLNVGAQN